MNSSVSSPVFGLLGCFLAVVKVVNNFTSPLGAEHPEHSVTISSDK